MIKQLFPARITITVAIGSLIVLAGLVWLTLMLRFSTMPKSSSDSEVLHLYSAAGIAHVIEQVSDVYHTNTGRSARVMRMGGSGELLGQIQTERDNGIDYGADILISADDRLVQQGVANGLFTERVPLALQLPVIATRADSSLSIANLRELIAAADTVPFGIAQRSAAIGELTCQIASDERLEAEIIRQSRLEAENVMMLAQALAAGSLDAAILWDTTVQEMNRHHSEPVLKIAARLDQNGTYVGVVSAGTVINPRNQRAVQDFIAFLTSPDGGLPLLASAGLQVIETPLREELVP